jgi:hypothetical protein
MTSIGVGKPHWRLTEERSMMRVVEKLEVLGRSTLNIIYLLLSYPGKAE